MTALDKVLALAGAAPAAPPEEDAAGELVLAAVEALADLRIYLADGDDDDDDDDGGDDDEDSENDHAGHPTFKALKRKGMDDGRAKKLCAQADKRVKAARLADAALIALGGLITPPRHDWVETTSLDHLALLGLAGDGKTPAKPYGDVTYADPGFRGKKRYPVDTPEHTRAANVYFSRPRNRNKYTPEQQARIAAAIKRAMAHHGIGSGDSDAADEKAAATALLQLTVLADGQASRPSGLDAAAEFIALAAQPVGDGGIIMNHAPFTGTHDHGHFLSAVHRHPHQHFGDNSHEGGPAHRPGSKPGGRPGWY